MALLKPLWKACTTSSTTSSITSLCSFKTCASPSRSFDVRIWTTWGSESNLAAAQLSSTLESSSFKYCISHGYPNIKMASKWPFEKCQFQCSTPPKQKKWPIMNDERDMHTIARVTTGFSFVLFVTKRLYSFFKKWSVQKEAMKDPWKPRGLQISYELQILQIVKRSSVNMYLILLCPYTRNRVSDFFFFFCSDMSVPFRYMKRTRQ